MSQQGEQPSDDLPNSAGPSASQSTVKNCLLCNLPNSCMCAVNIRAMSSERCAALLAAAETGDAEAVQQLLATAAATSAVQDLLTAVDRFGSNALHTVAVLGHHEIAQLLLAAGAGADSKGCSGATPLHLAAQEGHTDLVQLLLSAGATLDALNEHQHTPLLLAASGGHTEVLKLLLDQGASVTAADAWGASAVYHAVSSACEDDCLQCLKLLLAAGALIDKHDIALAEAASKGHDRVVAALLCAGVPPDCRGPASYSPLWSAVLFGSASTVSLLLAAGADPVTPGICAPSWSHWQPAPEPLAYAAWLAADAGASQDRIKTFERFMQHISTNPQPVEALIQAALEAARANVPTDGAQQHSMHDRQKGIVGQLLSAAVQQGTGTSVAAVLQDIMSRQDATNKRREHLLHEPLQRSAAAARVACVLCELWREAVAHGAAFESQKLAAYKMITYVAAAQVQGQQEAAAAAAALGAPAAAPGT